MVHNKGSSETLLTNISQLTWDLQTPNRPPTRTPFYRDDRDYSLRAVRLELLVRRGSSCPARLPTISSDIVMWFTLRSGCSSFKDNNGPHNEPGHHATGFVLPAFHDTPRNLKAQDLGGRLSAISRCVYFGLDMYTAWRNSSSISLRRLRYMLSVAAFKQSSMDYRCIYFGTLWISGSLFEKPVETITTATGNVPTRALLI